MPYRGWRSEGARLNDSIRRDAKARQPEEDRRTGERLRRIFELLSTSKASPLERMKVLQAAAAREIAGQAGKGLPTESPEAVWWPGLLVQLPPERVHALVRGIAERLEAKRNKRWQREAEKEAKGR